MEHAEQIVEQIIRPTGLVDPEVEVRPTKGQVDDLVKEIRLRTENGERVLVTTLTKRMAEDLADYLMELGLKVHYLHSEVETLERVGILRDLRLGVFDVVVGINLLREGLDLPEVSLVAILDADKEGFLRHDSVDPNDRPGSQACPWSVIVRRRMTDYEGAIDRATADAKIRFEGMESLCQYWQGHSRHTVGSSKQDSARSAENQSRVSRREAC
jgi:hypothetical protein